MAGRRVAARRAIEEIWTGANPAAIDEVYADGFIGRSNLSSTVVNGREDVRKYTLEFAEAIGNLRFEVLDQVCDGDTVATRWTGMGDRLALVLSELGLDTGPLRTAGITIHRFAGPQIVESWTYWDAHSLPRGLRLVEDEA